jgi:hypothetical protein
MNKLLKRGLTVATSLLLAATLSLAAVACNGTADNTNQDNTNENGSDSSGGSGSNGGGSNSGGSSNSSGGATHEHNYVQTGTVAATCTEEGYVSYSCTICSNVYKQTTPALGHLMEESSKSVRYLIPCSRGCGYAEMPTNANTYADYLKYEFSDEDKEDIADVITSLNKTIEEVGEYTDADVYVEGSEMYYTNEAFYENFYTLYASVYYVVYQNYCGELQYNVDTTVEDAKNNYQQISDYYTQLIQDYYSLFKSVYNSKLRNYFFYDWTEEEIANILSYTEAYDDELTALNNRNTEILLDYNTNYSNSSKIYTDNFTSLYAEFVENNNKIAQKKGFDNYLDYAYSEVYSRDYTYKDVHTIAEYYKKYLAPLLSQVVNSYYTSSNGLTDAETTLFDEINNSSFFSDITANSITNEFLDAISLYGTINYAQLFEDMINNGNYLLGNYASAYTVYLDMKYFNAENKGFPVTYYGTGYQDPSTIVHEFGHYTNNYYRNNDNNMNKTISQSYDLLETHSHGMEYMYLSYLKNVVSENVYNATKYYKLANSALEILLYMAVNMFEEAVYTNEYSGTYYLKIMNDGKITSDEYSLLFAGIMCDFGLQDYVYSSNAYYWRRVVIPQPCYYVSYSFSTLAGLEFYLKAEEEGLSAAVESHNKIINYVDEHSEYTYSQVLEYANLLSIEDEQLYVKLNKMFAA